MVFPEASLEMIKVSTHDGAETCCVGNRWPVSAQHGRGRESAPQPMSGSDSENQ